VAGSYFLRPAFPDSASHIANAGYLVVDAMRGRGFGRALVEHSLREARRCGFDAILFTLVLEGNPSRRLWRSLGFVEVGRIPDAVEGEAAYIYWRSLV
jgi:GNAT superfamily N-acetyltransferase